MTPEAQRIATAEACGWKTEYVFGNGMDCDATIDPNGLVQSEYPDYLNSLDAIHSAILSTLITVDQRDRYMDALHDVIEREKDIAGDSIEGSFWTANATARECCEAYLRAKGLFRE